MQLKKFLLFGLMAAVLPAFAEEAADRKTATSLKYVTHELDTRQNKFGAEQNKAMEYTNAAGTVQKRAVTSDLDNGGTESLPMVGGVNTKLNQKQDDIAAVNDHTAVTYTGTAGTIGRKGIYQTTESYAAQSDNLIDAKTFNAALKNGLDNEFKCRDYKPDTDLCWVYSIHNPTTDNTLLPPGYTPLEWIESNGTQYIDTGLKGNGNTAVEMRIQFPARSSESASGRIFGARNVVDINAFAFGTGSGNADTDQLFANYGNQRFKNTIVPGLIGGGWHVFEMQKNVFKVDEIEALRFNIETFETEQNLLLFAYINSNSQTLPLQKTGRYKCSYAKIWDNNVLVRDFVPAQHVENGVTVVGMYDTVSGRFFPSVPANTNFIAGPESNDTNIYIPQNQ